MATNDVPAGDPGLSQNAAPAQLAWQGRTARMPQFMGQADADVAAGSLPNPTSPPQQSTTQLGQITSDAGPATPSTLKVIQADGSVADYTPPGATSLLTPSSSAPAAGDQSAAGAAPRLQGGGFRQRFQHFLRPNSGGGDAGGGFGQAAGGSASSFAAPRDGSNYDPNNNY